MRRISVDDECRDGTTCPSVWADEDRPDEFIIVGTHVPHGTVPTSGDEHAIRVKRQVITAAKIAGH